MVITVVYAIWRVALHAAEPPGRRLARVGSRYCGRRARRAQEPLRDLVQGTGVATIATDRSLVHISP
jgi:hypothetical protein